MNAIDLDDGWYQRMAERAQSRRLARDAEDYANNPLAEVRPIHLHGTLTACPCGAETGITTVAFTAGWQQPDECHLCGKPTRLWGDQQPYRTDTEHEIGCPEHPDTQRCTYCGQTMITAACWDSRGWYHLSCHPDTVVIG